MFSIERKWGSAVVQLFEARLSNRPPAYITLPGAAAIAWHDRRTVTKVVVLHLVPVSGPLPSAPGRPIKTKHDLATWQPVPYQDCASLDVTSEPISVGGLTLEPGTTLLGTDLHMCHGYRRAAAITLCDCQDASMLLSKNLNLHVVWVGPYHLSLPSLPFFHHVLFLWRKNRLCHWRVWLRRRRVDLSPGPGLSCQEAFCALSGRRDVSYLSCFCMRRRSCLQALLWHLEGTSWTSSDGTTPSVRLHTGRRRRY